MHTHKWGFPGGAVAKNPPAKAGDAGDAGDSGPIPGLGRSTHNKCYSLVTLLYFKTYLKIQGPHLSLAFQQIRCVRLAVYLLCFQLPGISTT